MFRYILSALVLVLVTILVPLPASAVPEGLTLSWPGGGEGKVVFDGTVHAKKGLHCDLCHVAGLFQTKYGSDKMTMAEMNRGRFCGACHNGKKVFSTSDPKACRKCHQGKNGR
jgi:c(7)-type cytochrome triheme protein